MHVVAVLNSKGGCGKTTLATNLAVRAAANFERVALVDLDPTTHATDSGSVGWNKDRHKTGRNVPDMPEVHSGVDGDALETIDRLEQTGWDIAFLDGAPGTLSRTREMIGVADIVIVPEKLSKDDQRRTAMVVGECKRANVGALIVVSDVPLKSRGEYQFNKAQAHIAEVQEFGLPIFITHNRDIYLMAKDEGVGVDEIDGDGAKAARSEIDKIYEAVMSALLGEG